jgi:hypothetical protein
MTSAAGVAWRGGHTVGVGTIMVVMEGYRTRLEWLAVSSRFAKLRKSLRFKTLWRLYLYDTLLERLTQDLQDVAAAFRQFIQEQNAMVCQ